MCGNDYDKTMEISLGGTTHVFDSFECAIHVMAPRCDHCGCSVIGHGLQAGEHFFCCAHCAREQGISALTDRAPA
jgi:Rieske Fe-S protein